MIGLDDLCLATGGQLYGEATVREFSGISDDPARIRPGELFVVGTIPEAGQVRDIERALSAGAAGLLCEMPPTRDVTGVTTVLVGDARLGLEQWAAFVIRQYHPLTIMVLGDIGKTSLCDAIATALGSRYSVYLSSSTPAGPYQIAAAVGRLEPQHGYAVFEVSPDRYNNLPDIISILQPHVVAVSSPLSPVAGDARPLAASAGAIGQAFARIPGKITVVADAADRDRLMAIKPDGIRLVTYSADAGRNSGPTPPEVAADQVRFAVDGFLMNLRVGKESFRDIRLPGVGAPAVGRALAALAVCRSLDFPASDTLSGLVNQVLLPGIQVTTTAGGALLVDASERARPETALALLDWLDQLGDQVRRRFLVLGDFAKGGDRVVEMAHAIGRRSIRSLDALVALDETAAPAVSMARRAGFPVESTLQSDQRGEAVEFLRANVGSGDIVVVVSSQPRITNPVIQSLAGRGDSAASMAGARSQPLAMRPTSGERAWLEVDLQALSENVKLVRRQLQDQVTLIAVVKDDAYRHGAVEVSRAALRSGAQMLAVANVGEGLVLRAAGLECPIVVLSYSPAESLTEAVAADLTLSIQSHTHAALVAQAGRKLKIRPSCHIRVSGSAREAGVPVNQVISLVRELKKADQVVIDGLFIEFSPIPGAGWVGDSTRVLQQFTQITRNLAAAGVEIPYVHAAGSAAMLTIQNSIFSAARVGHLLYGIAPFATTQRPAGLKPALAWKTTAVDIIVERGKRSAAGGERRLAVIPIGYHDGLIRTQRSQAAVLIDGVRALITDAVGPDWAYVDVSALPGAFVGSDVVLIGEQGSDRITVEEIATQRGVAPYDVISIIPQTLPRLYNR